MPSTREIARHWDVAIATATRALAALHRTGLVRVERGVGTIVNPLDRQRDQTERTTATLSLDPSQQVTRQRIVTAAIEIADGEGVAALSMRRVASHLGLATMSLYRYVTSKEVLVFAMMDAAFAEAKLPVRPPSGWRAQLELVARVQWAGYQRHPWLAPQVSMTRPQMLPHGVLHTEWALRALDRLDLDPSAMLHMVVTLFGFIRGMAAALEAEVEAEQDSGMTGDEWIEAQTLSMMETLAAGPYPVMTRLTKTPGIDLSLTSLFEFGLARLLDGFAPLIGRQPDRGGAGSPRRGRT